jgi:excisionase family DNA binding protein
MKVSESTVRRLIRRGIIVAYKVGDRGQLRVKEDDLDKYLESQRVLVGTGDDPHEVPLESDE